MNKLVIAENTNAFFLSPKGTLIPVHKKHINDVIKYPKKFGLSKAKIQEVFDRYGEPLGFEGKARNEILVNLIRSGWIRMRNCPKQGFWAVNVFKLTNRVKSSLQQWASALVKNKSVDRYAEVRIADEDNNKANLSLADVAQDALYSASSHEVELKIVSSIKEFQGD
jgi:hypothetical protein